MLIQSLIFYKIILRLTDHDSKHDMISQVNTMINGRSKPNFAPDETGCQVFLKARFKSEQRTVC